MASNSHFLRLFRTVRPVSESKVTDLQPGLSPPQLAPGRETKLTVTHLKVSKVTNLTGVFWGRRDGSLLGGPGLTAASSAVFWARVVPFSPRPRRKLTPLLAWSHEHTKGQRRAWSPTAASSGGKPGRQPSQRPRRRCVPALGATLPWIGSGGKNPTRVRIGAPAPSSVLLPIYLLARMGAPLSPAPPPALLSFTNPLFALFPAPTWPFNCQASKHLKKKNPHTRAH